MPKSFSILAFLFLFGSLNYAAGQATKTTTQPPTKITNSPNPPSSAPMVTSPVPDGNAEARKLYKEGLDLMEAGEVSQAVESFQKALRLDNEYADAYSALGRAYFKLGQWQKSIDNIRRASELNAKQRQVKNTPLQNHSLQNGKSTGNPLMDGRTNSPIKQPQITNTNASGLKPAVPGSQPTREREVAASTPAKNVPTNAQLKQPQPLNANANNVKPPPAKASQPAQQTGNSTNNSSINSQLKQPQPTNANSSSLKTPLESTNARIPQQQEVVIAPARNPLISTPSNKTQPTNNNAANLKTERSETTMRSPAPPQVASTSTNHGTTDQTKQLQATNAAAANLKSAPSQSTVPPAQPLPTATAPAKDVVTNSSIKSPQTTNASADSKTLNPESKTTQPSMETRGAESTLKSDAGNGSDRNEPAGARISLNVTPTPMPVEAKPLPSSPAKSPSYDVSLTTTYRVGPSDVLDIRFNDSQSSRSTLFTVSPTGFIEHPMLTDPLAVTGFTVEEIGTKIRDDLVKRALNENPKVVVAVRDYASHTILVSGLVRDPGTKFLRREAIPLYVVVADAQPLPEAARVTLVRDGLSQIYEMDLTQVVDTNLLVRPGDVITLNANATEFVYIGGEVRFPGEKRFRRGLTLTQAILTSGVNPKSKVAQISRDNGQGFLVATRFNLQEIASGKAADPLLKAGDRIMILH
jgi:protein involved in polysaccharide export with SLBB domain/tetratricopeptide (TPR) repeat protein